MKRSHTQSSTTATATTPVKSPPSPPTTKKKVKYISAQQMQAAFVNVTKPLAATTTPPAPAPPSPPPAPKKAPPKRKAPQRSKSKVTPKENVPPSPPPAVSPEAAEILLKIDPIRFTDSVFKSNLVQASLLHPLSIEYFNILEYISNSQAHGFKIDLVSVLKIKRPAPPPFTPASLTSAKESTSDPPPKPFTMMLWHGTRPQFVASILYNGFMCPSSGNQMFGQGVYFADRISKSAQYCHPSIYCSIPEPGRSGYLFLCEVVLGKIYNAKKSNSSYKSAPTATRHDGSVMTFDSLMCTGAKVPDRQKQREINGVTWPLGPTIPNTRFPSYTVNYNEYIVYKPEEMVDIKYLVEVKFS